MANGKFVGFRAAALGPDNVDWVNDDIKFGLIDTDHWTVDLATDVFVSDIPTGALVATSELLGDKTLVGPAAFSGDVVFDAVTGNRSRALVSFKSTGVDSTSLLITYMDTGVLTSVDVTPIGVKITAKSPAAGWFSF